MRVEVLSRSLPYASFILRVLRDRRTSVEEFRLWLRRAGYLLGIAASSSLPRREVRVETPLGAAVEEWPSAEPLVVNVLGAGEFLAQGILDAYPGAPLGLVAARRVEENGVRVEIYYERLPRRWEGPAILADPMLATGSTIEAVARLLAERGSDPIIVASVIAAPEGLERLESLGDITVYTLALDPGLDSNYFIVPGLGDAGDRGLGVTP